MIIGHVTYVLAALLAAGGAGRVERDPTRLEPGRVIAEQTFDQDPGKLDFWNYEGLLTYGITNVNGEAIFRISNQTFPKDNKYALIDTVFRWRLRDVFPVEAGSEIAVVVEARGDVSMKDCGGKSGPQSAIVWYDRSGKLMETQDAKGNMIPVYENFTFESKGTAWVRSVARFTVPSDVGYARVQFGCDWPNIPYKGNLDFKRVTVRAREPGKDFDFGDMEPPTFERVSPSPDPDPMAAISFRVTDDSELDRSKFVCTLDGTNIVDRLERKGNVFTYRPTVPWEKDSLHLVHVAAADKWGNADDETLAFFCGEPIRSGLCTLRDDGMTLIDGKPFFPIAPFSYQECPVNGNDFVKGFRDLQAQGINAIQTYRCYHAPEQRTKGAGKDYHRQFLAITEASDRTGMKVICEAGGRDYGNPRRPEHLRELMVFAREHPNFLVWVLGDDTASFRKPKDVKNDSNIIKAIDNARFTGSADITTYENVYGPFVHAVDIEMTEIYPFRAEKPEPEGLANVNRFMGYAFADKRRAGDPVKGIWALIQTFAEDPMWKRFPTKDEIRGQAYLAIIRGSRAMTFFNYYSWSKTTHAAANDPDHLERLYAVSRELGALHDDLASRDAKRQPKVMVLKGEKKDLCRFDTVTCLLKEGAEGKSPLLIAASSRTDQTTPVEIALPSAAAKAEVLFENRTVTVKDGVLADSFGPGEVHVYRLK